LPFSAATDRAARVGIFDQSVRQFDGAFQERRPFDVHRGPFGDVFTQPVTPRVGVSLDDRATEGFDPARTRRSLVRADKIIKRLRQGLGLDSIVGADPKRAGWALSGRLPVLG
jgi:hypothetical protein